MIYVFVMAVKCQIKFAKCNYVLFDEFFYMSRRQFTNEYSCILKLSNHRL